MNKKRKMPMITLQDMTIFPNTVVHIDVSRKQSFEAIKEAMMSDLHLFVVAKAEEKRDQDEPGDRLEKVGCAVKVRQMIRLNQKNLIRILVAGESRGELLAVEQKGTYLQAELEIWEDMALSDEQEEAYCSAVLEAVVNCYQAGMPMSQMAWQKITKEKRVGVLIDLLAENLPFSHEKKQQILAQQDLLQRILCMMRFIKSETEIGQIRRKLQEDLSQYVEKSQREYILREQKKMIEEELEEDDDSEIEEYKEAVEGLQAPKEVEEKLYKEIQRLEAIPITSSESAVLRNYIETLLAYPWNKATTDNRDLQQAEKILNADHYGLWKVKERILDFLAVRNMVAEGDSPILCLVGPPGTGKTSVARSIARATNKEYVRISLGGIRDEAEIRGHRKTYVGAMPGRIAKAMERAGVRNPLMLLDEVDKLGNDYKGDPSSALLEVLDAEQNCRFTDHFFEVPIDLSQVLFVATANDVSNIPKPLLDRMEVIEISGYTQNEKLHIAKDFLIAKQRTRHGLKAKQFQVTDAALRQIITGYTREAGVRNLERQIATLCRKADRMIASGGGESLRVNERTLERYLGIPKYKEETWNLKPKEGMVNGLAWTSVGGDMLSVEVSLVAGSGKIELTGNLGDVMKESAKIAITCVRAKVQKNFLKNTDIHIHVPEGAVPKDGPSAGITISTAVYSAVTHKKVRGDLAMTGEVSLRGRVLPVGGLKEKLLAANTFGMREVLLPQQNDKDVSELDDEIIGTMKITYVKTMEDVLRIALIK